MGWRTKCAKGLAGQFNSSENQRQLRTIPWGGAASALQNIEWGEKRNNRGWLQAERYYRKTQEKVALSSQVPKSLSLGSCKMPWKIYRSPKGAVFPLCACSLHPAPSNRGGLGAIPRDERRSTALGAEAVQSWDHSTGQEYFTPETTNPGCSLRLKSHLWRGLRHKTPNPAAGSGSGSPQIKPGELQGGIPRAAEPRAARSQHRLHFQDTNLFWNQYRDY